MIDDSQILSVADKIAQQFHPERIIPFVSYAYGTPNEDSDVDLLVVMPLPKTHYCFAAACAKQCGRDSACRFDGVSSAVIQQTSHAPGMSELRAPG